jgi:hypothetical protein
MFVENVMILELKFINRLKAIHEAQLLSYMKLAQVDHCFLINFNHGLLVFHLIIWSEAIDQAVVSIKVIKRLIRFTLTECP